MRYLVVCLLLLCWSCAKTDDGIDFIDPNQDTFFKDGDVEVVFENDRNEGINVIFMGDAYLASDLGQNYGAYRADALKHINALFEMPPFSEYVHHFNAYIVYVASNVDTVEGIDTIADTAFGTVLGSGGPGGLTLLTITDYEQLNHYVAKVKNLQRGPKTLVLMSVNNAGRGSAVLGGNLAVFGSYSIDTMLHEVGHAFARLGDEYVLNNAEPKNTQGIPNLDITSDLSNIKWKHFVERPGYNFIGAFEGGGYVPTGIWRPESRSLMGGSGEFFNAPSREAIVQRIMAVRGIPYDLNAFLETDSISMTNMWHRGPTNRSVTIHCTNH